MDITGRRSGSSDHARMGARSRMYLIETRVEMAAQQWTRDGVTKMACPPQQLLLLAGRMVPRLDRFPSCASRSFLRRRQSPSPNSARWGCGHVGTAGGDGDGVCDFQGCKVAFRRGIRRRSGPRGCVQFLEGASRGSARAGAGRRPERQQTRGVNPPRSRFAALEQAGRQVVGVMQCAS